MNKKYSIIFIVLAVMLFILFGLYNYTNLFASSKKPTEYNNRKTNQKFNYDYIKSHDMNKKTKIAFPVFTNMKLDSTYYDEYYKSFNNNDDLTLTAVINEYNEGLDNCSNKELNGYKEIYSQSQINSTDIACDYTCKRISIYQENKIFLDIIKIYFKLSEQEIGIITLKKSNDELSQEMINDIINNIKITYDATYKIGIVENDKLIIKLKLGNVDVVNLKLDQSIYEEIESEANTISATVIQNKNDGGKIYLTIRSRVLNLSIKEEIDIYHDATNPGSNVTEIMVGDKKVYQYDIENKNNYAYIINDDCALLINSDSDIINLNDFLNFNT